MPIYEYRCRVCGWKQEHLLRTLDEAIKETPCLKCGGEIYKVPSTFTFRM